MRIDQILERKRDNKVLSDQEIRFFVQGIVDGSISRPQATAFLAFTFLNGMTEAEMVSLTIGMADSGHRLRWADYGGLIADKHSTGGVGDKVSLILAPLWACLGVKVPMISGRGLGHTGGTLDKLESIQGYRTDIPEAELAKILDTVGCFICSQTKALAPADRILYALRNETSTVPCIPLIVASILSKKLAEGIDTLVMDVKYGSGAFMKTRTDAYKLGQALERVGTGAGLNFRTILSDMNQPLGEAVGNSLEVQEAIRCLKGEGPEDLATLVCDLIDDPRAIELLASGKAYDKFVEMVEAQGGDLSKPLKDQDTKTWVYHAPASGIVKKCDAYNIGYASVVLGGGRSQEAEPIHHGVGLMVHEKIGAKVSEGQPLVTVYHVDKGLEDTKRLLEEAYQIEPC